MILKYNIEVNKSDVVKRLHILINQLYKLLPLREEGQNWEKPLQTLIEQLCGLFSLLNENYNYTEISLPLLSKLEGLVWLNGKIDFFNYRRVIFDCLHLMNTLKSELSKNGNIE